MNIFCRIGFHKYGKPHYSDYGIHSNTREYRQKCSICGKVIAWIQPKEIDYRFYPLYWTKKDFPKALAAIAFLAIIYLIIKIIRN